MSLSCKCGEVKICFAVPKPVFTAECGCMDCVGKLNYLARTGGPEMCPKVASQDECLKLLYFQDKFTCTGKDKLKFTQIAEGTTSTNCIATCCNTCVLVDNFFYHQGSGDVGSTDGSGVVMMFEQHTPTGIESEPAIRWWVKDLPEEKLAAMPPLPGFHLATAGDLTSGFVFVGEGEAAFGEFSKAAALPASEEGEGTTFSALLAECGGKLEIEPYDEEGVPPASATIERGSGNKRMSGWVKHGGVVYLSGQVGAPGPEVDGVKSAASVTDQATAIFAKIDGLLAEAGTDKSKALQGQVWLSDIGDFAEFNAVWDAWVTPGAPPVRACTEAKLAAPFFTVEVMITAAA